MACFTKLLLLCAYFKLELTFKGHLNVKVKVTQSQGQIKGNQFSVYCNWFYELCVMQMVRLRLKALLQGCATRCSAEVT